MSENSWRTAVLDAHPAVIGVGGVTGAVAEIGLFATTINTPDNVLTIVGNNKLFSDNIQNF